MSETDDIQESYEDWEDGSELTPYQYNQNRPYRQNRPYKQHNRREPWLRNLIEIILYNEMLNRRRRYRGRKRWF